MGLVECILFLAPTIDSNQTKQGGRCPWCQDEALSSGFGVAVPQAKLSVIAADDWRQEKNRQKWGW